MNFNETLEVYRQYGMKKFLEWRKSIILNNKEKSEIVTIRDLRNKIAEGALSIIDDICRNAYGVNAAEWDKILLRKEGLKRWLSDFEKIYLNKYSDVKDKYDKLEHYRISPDNDNNQPVGSLDIKLCRDIVGKIEKLDNDSDLPGYSDRECKFLGEFLNLRNIAYSN